MIFRLGYVAMAISLEKCSPSGTVTYAVYSRLAGSEAKSIRLDRVAKLNLENTHRILKYNRAMNIEVYRLTSKLIPLATHSELAGWDYAGRFGDQLRQIGDYIKANNFRISAHPDHFTILNPVKEEVLRASLNDLDYHVRLYEAMGLEDYKYKLVLHVGGLYGDKYGSIERFKENYIKLPDRIRRRIIIENDDKSFTAADVLELCKELNAPMVLDVHHHKCVNNGEEIKDLLPEIFETWSREVIPPKIHFSSPKSEKEFRSHADFINYNDFMDFINIAKNINRDIDIMLEAKMKDMALLELAGKLDNTEGIVAVSKAAFQI